MTSRFKWKILTENQDPRQRILVKKKKKYSGKKARERDKKKYILSATRWEKEIITVYHYSVLS